MRGRDFLLLLALALVVAFVLARRLRPPPAPVVEAPPPPAVERRAPPLQADAEGWYVPGYRFTVGRWRFAGFRLRPEALVSFAPTAGGGSQRSACPEARIRPETMYLRCEHPQVGTVTIDGRFLARTVTTRLDLPVVSAVVTVRSVGGEILYSARDAFVWQGPD
ncbi:MAG TPA: hypothetical protein VNI61_02560 [Gemmatimonadales bacterium]|nr:hypothetical protein [Gemmatimonadales bacterium]